MGAFLVLCYALPSQGGGFDAERRKMMEEVLADAAAISSYSGSSALSPGVIAAMGEVERHRFVPDALAAAVLAAVALPGMQVHLSAYKAILTGSAAG